MLTKCYRFVTVLFYFCYFSTYCRMEIQKASALLSRIRYYFNTLVLYPAPIGLLNWYGTSFDRYILWDRSNARFSSKIIESRYQRGEPKSHLFYLVLSISLALC
jgi:hypothetical protein